MNALEQPAHDPAGGLGVLVPLLVVGLGAMAYLALAWRQHRSPRGWSPWRTAACLAGSGLLALGLLPQFLPFPAGDFREHMLQHLLMGMIAPLGLVMAAPVTLLLRSMPRPFGRTVVGLLRTRLVRLVSRPALALVLNIGGMGALYFTPLFQASMSNPLLHHVIQVHFVLAGYLFAWVIAGPDPAPDRPGVPYRLVVLGVAIAFHAIFAQLLYAGLFVAVDVPAAERRGAAELMYYGGDIAELMLAFALVSTWRPRRRNVRLAPGTANA